MKQKIALKSLIPFLDCCFVVSRVTFEKVHILFGKSAFASEAAHRRDFAVTIIQLATGHGGP
jgi:hypothetical protein